MPTSPFEALIEDLAALQAARTVRENAARAARQAHESARNRRLQQMQQQPRRLMKSEPVPLPNYTPDWDGLAARQEQIAAGLEQSRVQAQKDAIRAHIATLMAAARAGRLDPHSVCVLDVLRGRADSMGIAP